MFWQAVVIIVLLICIIALLLLKLAVMKYGIREISESLPRVLNDDTNALVTVQSADKDMHLLVRELNSSLITLRNMRQKYDKGDKELKTAITNISHDIRTPLTAIMGYISLAEQEEMNEELKADIAVIKDRCLALKKLSEELFDYSVTLSKEAEVRYEEVYINKLLQESLMNAYASLKEKNIEPVIHITDKKIMRFTDETSLSRIIQNILSNAVKYSDGDLYVSLSPSGVMKFSNTAEGITHVELERLFDRFFTVNDSRVSTGLGLAIAKKLATDIGAELTAQLKNKKLSFILKLPE